MTKRGDLLSVFTRIENKESLVLWKTFYQIIKILNEDEQLVHIF